MKSVWLVYPYGAIVGESFLEARYIRFGRVLADAGYKVTWWTTNFSHTFKKKRCTGRKCIEVCDNFHIEMLPAPGYKSNISIGRVRYEIAFSKQLKKAWDTIEKPDVILTAGTGLITAFDPITDYVSDENILVVYDIMDVHMFETYIRQKHKILSPIAHIIGNSISKREQRFYKRVNAVSGLGRNQLQIAINRTGKSNIPNCLVYNGIDVKTFRARMDDRCNVLLPKKEDEWIWCVYAGSLGPSYDIESIIQAATIANKNNDKIKFIVIGAGPQEDYIAKEASNNSNLYFVGSVKPEELPPIYKQCDIGLATYADYSTVDMPDKFYDYCAAGLAIVNSLQGEVKEHIRDERLGMQYNAGDGQSLYDAIKEIREKDIEGNKKNAYMMGEVFDFNNQMKSFLRLLAELT